MVTKSFTVEGRVRMAQAEADLLAPRAPVHTLIVMPNRRLLKMGDKRILFRDSLKVADAI
jgi:cell division GTPase FtsZ